MEQAVAREAARVREVPPSINATPEQARLRVLEARTGSLLDSTDVYLSALRGEVQSWLAEIDCELALRISRQSLEERAP
jgi:hypothetical protein